VGKWWSVLFGVMMVAAAGLFVVAPFVGWWMPEGVSSHAGAIDGLFNVILAITGFFFILTEALLVYFMWVYAARPGQPGHVFGHHAAEDKVFWTKYFKWLIRPVSARLHDPHRVERAWTLVPAVILLYIAFAQVDTWAEVKYVSRLQKIEAKKTPVQVEVSARQFEWRVRYPSHQRMKEWLEHGKATDKDYTSFARTAQPDDVHVVNELHVVNERHALVQLRTLDVLHSFNIPYMRVKQDSLPGKIIPVWFKPIKANTLPPRNDKNGNLHWQDGGGYDAKTGAPKDRHLIWEIACAELCGWGHYRMIGRVYVHKDENDFLAWLKDAEERQQSTQPGTPTTAAH
jgi:cytochrome c oxidase subunit 2